MNLTKTDRSTAIFEKILSAQLPIKLMGVAYPDPPGSFEVSCSANSMHWKTQRSKQLRFNLIVTIHLNHFKSVITTLAASLPVDMVVISL